MHENELPFINGGEPVEWAPEIPIWLSLVVIVGTLAVTAVVEPRRLADMSQAEIEDRTISLGEADDEPPRCGIAGRAGPGWAGVSTRRPALSVLDLVPVRSDQTTARRVAATLSLARVADELGYRRYWLAEHHNMPAVAATNPPVLIGAGGRRHRAASGSGSGGVMLPNHAPLVVAEQFALLEAAYPGRIDLGIGRAPGSDPVTTLRAAPRRRRGQRRGGHPLPRVRRQRARDDGARRASGLAVQGRTHPLRATPRATSVPDDLAARLLGLLRPAGGREGAALRLRAPLLRQRAPPRRSSSTARRSGPRRSSPSPAPSSP